MQALGAATSGHRGQPPPPAQERGSARLQRAVQWQRPLPPADRFAAVASCSSAAGPLARASSRRQFAAQPVVLGQRQHPPAVTWQLAAQASDTDGSDEERETVPGPNKKAVPVRPELAGELAPLAAQCGLGSSSLPALARTVAALGPKREQGVLLHGQQVAAYLQQLGVQQEQLGELLQHCPLLFRWPAEQRAAVLVEQQLMGRLGLKPAEAAECFLQQPGAARSPSFEPAIEALLPLAAATCSSNVSSATLASDEAALGEAERQAAERALGVLLRQVPAAVTSLMANAATLRQSLSVLHQRYGLSAEQVVKALKSYGALLSWDLASVLPALEAALQQELPGVDGRQLIGAMAAFTREQLQGLKPRPLAQLLNVNTAVWQLALAVWANLGVKDPVKLALKNAKPLAANWLEPGRPPARLVNLLALQRYGPALAAEQQQQPQQPVAQPSTASVLHSFAGYVPEYSPKRLAGRLLFLQQEQLSRLLVASREEWRRERGLPPGKLSFGEPPLLSISNVATFSDAKFCALPALRNCGQQQQESGGLLTASGSPADRYGAFMAALDTHPPYQQLQAAAAELQERLLRDPEVARLASSLGQRRREKSRR